MGKYYIAGVDNGGLVFYRISESEKNDFITQYGVDRIKFIVTASEFMNALSYLI